MGGGPGQHDRGMGGGPGQHAPGVDQDGVPRGGGGGGERERDRDGIRGGGGGGKRACPCMKDQDTCRGGGGGGEKDQDSMPRREPGELAGVCVCVCGGGGGEIRSACYFPNRERNPKRLHSEANVFTVRPSLFVCCHPE